MKRIIRFLLILFVMFVVSIICLGVVSMFAYIYKWQADKAMIGIIAVYTVAGIVGGIMTKKMNRGTLLEVILLGTIYMILLPIASVLLFKNDFVFSTQFFRIYVVMICSMFLGRYLVKEKN